MSRVKLPSSKSLIHLLLLAIHSSLYITTRSSHAGDSPPPQELRIGFKSTPDPSISSFQPILTDSTGNYSFGFLRTNKNQLTLSVLHAPSSVPVWSANTTRFARWSDPTELLFNGSLVLSDPRTGVFWSTYTSGDRVWLSGNSNLQIQKLEDAAVLWESFRFPSDTLVENQNLTSAMRLVSSNGLYSMRLGPDYFGLYANLMHSNSGPGQMYLKHGALEAKADIVEGRPIYLVLKPDGYLGMFQNGSTTPVDVESFNSFQQNNSGNLRVRIEPDGNLKGYYWTGSDWVTDYQAISDPCELPGSCGPYGLCKPGKECSCLDNRTTDDSGKCTMPENRISGDFCGVYDNRYKVIRRSGVELPFKELMGFVRMDSYSNCEFACERNCTCWGVVYSNFSGFCYMLEFPIQTLLAVGDDTKMGYFKVRQGVGKKRVGTWLGVGLGLLLGAIVIFVGLLGLGWFRMRKRGVKGYLLEEEGSVGVGPYKDLGAASFRSIELCAK